jgi:DNA-binding transcriptional regulator LsrR (DeoR family)
VGKKPKSRDSIRAKFAKAKPPKYRLRPANGVEPEELDTIELMTAVCELICEGWPVAEILIHMRERYGRAGIISRELVYDLLHHAADEGWLVYRPPDHLEYRQFILDRYDWLSDIQVVHTATLRDIAARGAQVVLDIFKEYADRERVRVGLAGGISLRSLISSLAELLCGPIPEGHLPRQVVFHSLVSGFDLHDPTTDPSTFFTFFVDKPGLKIEPGFVGLFAPALIKTADFSKLRKMDGIREAFEEAENLDVVLTSGADWRDPHSLLRRSMKTSGPALESLAAKNCTGDLMWRPIGLDGPILTRTRTRAFTLFELERLAEMVADGKQVVFMAGPCAGCRRPKGSLLNTVLEQKRPLVSHVITDSRSAGEVYARYTT